MPEDLSQPVQGPTQPIPPPQPEIKEEITSLGTTPPPSGKSKKLQISLGILGLVFILTSIPVAIYLVQQRQEIRKEAVLCGSVDQSCTEDYPEACKTSDGKDGVKQCHKVGTCTCIGGGVCCSWGAGSYCEECVATSQCTPLGGDCTTNKECCSNNCSNGKCQSSAPSNCQPVKEYSGATTPGYDCSRGGPASVTVKACLPEGCPLNGASVSYSKTVARCGGKNRANCEGACGAQATTATLTISVGKRCNSATVSCNPPNDCGTCQVDIDGYGVRKWENSGCEKPTPTPTPTPKVTPTPTPKLTPTPTPPGYAAQCEFCKTYDEDWNEITDLSTLTISQVVYFATRGSTNHPQGITEARFRINGGDWQETTDVHGTEFYIQYTIPSAGAYTIESMVYNPVLGWY